MKKILIVSCLFPPHSGPAVQRSYYFAKHLPEYGWLPTIVTSKILNEHGVEKSLSIKDMDVRQVETWEIPNFWKTLESMKLRFVTRHFASLDRFGFLLPGILKIKKILATEKFDALYVSISPNLFLSIPILLRPWFLGQIVIDYRDPSYDYEANVWHSHTHERLIYKLTESANNNANLIICNTPSIHQQFKSRWSDDASKSYVIRNGWSVESRTLPTKLSNKLTIFFAGSLTRSISRNTMGTKFSKFFNRLGRRQHETIDTIGRTLVPMTDALQILRNKNDPVANKIKLSLAGVVNEYDLNKLQSLLSSGCVNFHGIVNYAQTLELMSTADILFLPHWDHPKYSRTVAAKMYEYLSAHKPILACIPDGQMKDDLRHRKHVIIASPTNPESIATAICQIHDNYEEFAKAALDDDVSEFSRYNQTSQLAKLLDSWTS